MLECDDARRQTGSQQLRQLRCFSEQAGHEAELELEKGGLMVSF
jgi:hypothetical protein